METTALPCCNNFDHADSLGLATFVVVLLELVEVLGIVEETLGVAELFDVVERGTFRTITIF